MARHLLIAIILTALFAGAAKADSLSFTDSAALGLEANALFENIGGGKLRITLTNTSLNDVLIPVDVLTGVFFDISGDPTLTPLSAMVAAGSVISPSDTVAPTGADGNVGGEWAYARGFDATPYHPGSQGVSSTGLGLFGSANFGGDNLAGPIAVNGLQYGIASAGDNPTTGNTPVTGGSGATANQQYPLVRNSVVFELSGIGSSFDPKRAISNVSFQYGTSLGELNPVPEPGTFVLLAGVLGGAFVLRRRRRS